MEHAVLGAGAIGGLVGTAVASLGEGVTVLVRPERLPGYPANLSVERPSGAITALAKVAATLTNPVDVLWIATKTYQLKAALQAVQKSTRPRSRRSSMACPRAHAAPCRKTLPPVGGSSWTPLAARLRAVANVTASTSPLRRP